MIHYDFCTLEFFYGVVEVGHLIVSTKKGKWFEIITSSIDKGKLVSDFFRTKSIDPYKIGGIVPRSLFWCKFFCQMYLCFLWTHLLYNNSMEIHFFQVEHCILFWIVLLVLWMRVGVFLYLVTNEIMNLSLMLEITTILLILMDQNIYELVDNLLMWKYEWK